MQMEVRVGDATLTALVDSGSTHNFVSKATRDQLSLTMQPTHTGMRCHGEWAKVGQWGVAHNLLINIQGETFMDCYTFPLSGFDLILGVCWLETLGPIVGLWATHHVFLAR